jgi:hypothetical protein
VAEKKWPTVLSNNRNEEPAPVVSYAKNRLKTQSRARVSWLENMNRSSVSRSQQRIALVTVLLEPFESQRAPTHHLVYQWLPDLQSILTVCEYHHT